jgi:hypothetical protein
MPNIGFCFQGWIRGATVSHATNRTGARVDVSSMTEDELCDKLESGELSISLGDYLSDNHKASIEMYDFTG